MFIAKKGLLLDERMIADFAQCLGVPEAKFFRKTGNGHHFSYPETEFFQQPLDIENFDAKEAFSTSAFQHFSTLTG